MGSTSDDHEDEASPLKRFLAIGSEIASAMTGAGVGLVVAGPPGALAGAAISPVLERAFLKLAKDFHQRVLSHREEVRIGATLAHTIESARTHSEKDEEIRGDDFFEVGTAGVDRSAAEEILEGVLITAAREYEERKLRHYGSLMSSIAFQENIDLAQANLLLRLARDLSYRQLCILALAQKGPIPLPVVFVGEALDDGLIREMNLLRESYLLMDDEPPGNGEVVEGRFWVGVNQLGWELADAMDLRKISEDDLSKVAAQLHDTAVKSERVKKKVKERGGGP
jgi:hypothetical protein